MSIAIEIFKENQILEQIIKENEEEFEKLRKEKEEYRILKKEVENKEEKYSRLKKDLIELKNHYISLFNPEKSLKKKNNVKNQEIILANKELSLIREVTRFCRDNNLQKVPYEIVEKLSKNIHDAEILIKEKM